jgi:KipI family sensor histidine kinase inhibitor
MRVTRYGQDGWLIHTHDPVGLAARIDATHLEDVVPGADCVLVRGTETAMRTSLVSLRAPSATAVHRSVVALEVTWDGADLDEVARTSGLGVNQVVSLMQQTTFTVAFCGFVPGFGYLTGLPEQLHLPRRDRPRPSVAAGSIAIAAGYCAVYPTSSPGGWHLLGTSAAVLFDATREHPALLSPGTQVRFT